MRIELTNTRTNLTDWQIKGKGRIEDNVQGLLLRSEPQEDVMAMSGTTSQDFTFEADVMVTDIQADATLVFRSSEDGCSSYMLQIVPAAGLLRLRDAAGDIKRLKEERQVKLQKGDIYHLKVKVEGSQLKVYWDEGYRPIIDVVDTTYASGYLGLNVWNGSALFQNIQVSDMDTNVDEPFLIRGKWQPDLKGQKAEGTSSEGALKIFSTTAADLVMEGSVTLNPSEPGMEAGLFFRGNPKGTEGYVASVQREDQQVRVHLRKANGALVTSSVMVYPNTSGSKYSLEIITYEERIRVFIDGYTPAAIDIVDNSYSSGFIGMKATGGTAYFQDIYLTSVSNYYTEKYRPQYHYSPARGSASDPNGLVYFEGEYHLFHQDGGQWAHAVSLDLLDWKRLPLALKWNDLGHIWSGSAVADLTNTSGLFSDYGGKGLIAYYTSYNPDQPKGNQRIGLAYSTDRGRTWQYPENNSIVIENPGQNENDPGNWDFRDPKVVWDEAHQRWIMVVSGGDHIRFFTSANLLDWSWTDNFGYGDYIRGGVWECPDLFPLAVDKSNTSKWVLMISTGASTNTQGSDAEYFIGELTSDGKFQNDLPPGKVLKTDWGKEFYASMSFSNMPCGRRIMLAWMTNWDYPFSFPTSPWKGQFSIPRELSLKTTHEGIRLIQHPISELTSLRSHLFSLEHASITESSPNILEGLKAGAYEIEAEFEFPSVGMASTFGFCVREGGEQRTVVGYKTDVQQMFINRTDSGLTDFSPLFSTLHEASLAPVGNRIQMRIFVDESSVEVFGNHGEVVFSDIIFPDSARRGMSFYAQGGEVKIVSLHVYALHNSWRVTEVSPIRLIMDYTQLELAEGRSKRLYASVEDHSGRKEHLLNWESSNPAVVKVISSNEGYAITEALSPGEAVVTASIPGDTVRASTSVTVHGGKFYTNLSGWVPDVSASRWMVTTDGMRGSYISDANYMASEQAKDFTYEADMKLYGNGSAGSMIFRANADGASGYYLNLDPNMKSIRLFYKKEGRFEEQQVLAKVPRFVLPGVTYHIKIQAEGLRLRIEIDNEQVMDLEDDTFAEGHFGINVFGGQAFYQHVRIEKM
ncbi:levanbiose-producing levanase [Paenibacillus jamilae]|jgi:levanase|uniref:GH32 C-terminal domain-containing protein n=1 Tax=Paenibacillus polymyxa TaxID=1406 RepID=UPI0015811780|nr:GH32 C-terminal domain-containing protein [Paenibacillus polymyxa]MDP9675947.1 levanbiose-producing levanase [Paenibacillus jamilae]MBY0021090.1 GH32 C-terminal domain-containing protein [Paenibacillus polymyxa]MBY0057497.1 GH32 C-terminal domain-containing protein [Paenibacillus polymyxa]MBY0070935.1 GH32 C-terminal domain-containing protein [Paenibacillus polymyxa]MBY0082243.1 GH32 C-terminal domain-containing protein [Paenibacillus polymyxa]